MDVVETENSNDSTDKIKEKVRVVSLEDPSIIASEFAGNSNNSVWSLCGLNSDDHDVDLGDISPSISPIFTEQQMADHLRERLMNEDHIFSREHASETRLHENSRPSSDLESHLELFDREMKSLESNDSGDECKSKKEGDFPRDGGHLATKIPGKSSPRKRGVDTSVGQEAGIALRTRNRRHNKQAGEVGRESGKDYNKVEGKDKENLSKGNGVEERSERADEKPETVSETDQIKLNEGDKSTEINSVSNSFAEDMENTASGGAGVSNTRTGSQANSPDKRVTRSTTGNLKPKQQFDEIQEKEEMKHCKMKEGKTKQAGKKRKDKDGGRDKEDDKDKLTGEEGKDDGILTERETDDKASGDESSSDDDEVDFHEDDSDYSPEDDPDRPWCICRKPHGNKFMICCDGCEEWFHGKCVGITMEKGRTMEKRGKEYVCDKCKEKKVKELMMAEKARELAETIKIKPDTTTQEEPKKPRPKRKINSNNIIEPDSSEKPTQVSSPSQSDEVKKRRVKDPPGFKIPKKVRTTPTPVSHSTVQAPKKCIVEGCPKTSFEGAVYCGRSCIERHVSEAVKMLTSKEHGGKLHTSEGNRVSMIEKSSGRLVAGMAAPVVTNLTDWILKNPSFQVLVSGVTSPTSQPSSSFYNKVNAESKQKKEIDKKSEEETVRSNVRRMMKDILVERKKESSDIRISVEEIMKLVRKIEEDMYKAFKDTSHRYKAKYRTLMFNLRDPRNKVLYKRVLTGDIDPDKLIWMTSDELATKELAQWREQETKHMIDMIRKEEENTNKTRFIKKTHKGEVDMGDDEDLSTLEVTNINEVQEKKPKVEEIVETPVTDTTEEHRAHLFDLNCKICTGKMAPPGEIAGKSPSMSNVPIQAAAESSIPSPPPIQEPSTYTEPLSPDSRSTTPDFSNATSKAKETSVWKGFVMMQNVAKFGTNAFLVSGSGDNLIQVLPDTLHVHGRIAHKHVWDYVKQCKTSSSRELCIIRFAAATDEEKISYVSLYSYFHSRKRCGVIGNCYSGVKDMYLVPLASHEPIPSHLLPFSGPGLQEPRPHMLLGLIVKNKIIIPAKRSRSGSDRVSSKTQSTEPPSKRTSIDDPSPKSSTSSSQPTIAKPSDSPVDEIEDIVFHYHNSQGTKPEPKPAQPAKPSQPASIPPMISALLKIQEQEKKLRELQKQSELLEKELAPMGSVAIPDGVGQSSVVGSQSVDLMPAAPGFLSQKTTVSSNHLSEQIAGLPKLTASQAKGSMAYPPGNIQTAKGPAVPFLSVDGPQRSNVYPIEGATNIAQSAASQQLTKAHDADNEPYDPETANNEEAPYDPEDMDTMDLGLDETPSPEKTAAVSTQPPTSLDNFVVASQIASTIVKQTLAGSTVAGSLQQSILSNTIGKPQAESLVKTLMEHVKKQPNANPEISLKPEQNITQRSIPKELEEKVQSLLKSEHSSLAKQTDKKREIPSNNVGEPGPERRDPGVYHHTRDFPEKREFPERREFLERRGPSYNDGRDDPKFYSSRFSLRHGGDERGGPNRGGQGRGGGSHRQGYDRDYRSRENREDDRHWDERGDGRRRNDHFHRNRDRYQRDRNWRR